MGDDRRALQRYAQVMVGWFYNLGRMIGPKWRKTVWAWQSLTGSEADRIEAEYRVGRDLAEQIDAQHPHPVDSADQQQIDTIGRRLVGCLADRRLRFRFAVLPAGEPNAFALPGGFIYFHAGLLNLCEHHGGELAFVCAHEIGHVVKGHAMRRMIEQSTLSLATLASPARGALGGWVKRAGLKFFASAYSQINELEADGFAARLMHAAGIDPRHGLALLGRLARLENQPAGPLSQYLSSHPPTARRLAELKTLIASVRR